MFELKTYNKSFFDKWKLKKKKSELMFLDDDQATMEVDKLISLEEYWKYCINLRFKSKG